MAKLKFYLQIYSLPFSIVLVGCFLYFFVFDTFEQHNATLLSSNKTSEINHEKAIAEQIFMYEELKKIKHENTTDSISHLFSNKKNFTTINPNYFKQQYSTNIQFETIAPTKPKPRITKKNVSHKQVISQHAINHPYQFINTHAIRSNEINHDYLTSVSKNLPNLSSNKKQWAVAHLDTIFIYKSPNLSSKAICTATPSHKLPILDLDNTWVFVQCRTAQRSYVNGYVERKHIRIVQ